MLKTKPIIISADERVVIANRFWAHVQKAGIDHCWPWLGETQRKGYGKFCIHRHRFMAHRIAYYLFYDVQPDEVVMHSCDNPPCCNPGHLRSATNLENVQDMFAKGRNVEMPPLRMGDKNGKAKLSSMDIPHIRQMRVDGLTLRQIATRFDVSYLAIYKITKGITWRHIL